MKTNTILRGVIYSTEQVEIKVIDGMKVILTHCIETQSDKECRCADDIFDDKLDYNIFRDYHDSFVKNSLR